VAVVNLVVRCRGLALDRRRRLQPLSTGAVAVRRSERQDAVEYGNVKLQPRRCPQVALLIDSLRVVLFARNGVYS